MATTYLQANENYRTGVFSPTNFVGMNGGNESLEIVAGDGLAILDANIETVKISSFNAADTVMKIVGGKLLITDTSGNCLVRFDAGMNQATLLAFQDSTVQLTQTGASSYTMANPSDANEKVTIDADSPQAGNAIEGGQIDDPSQAQERVVLDNKGSIKPHQQVSLDAGGKDYLFIDNADLENNVVIGNFTRGDQIQMDTESESVFVTSDGEDVLISTNQNGVMSMITLAGIADPSKPISGVQELQNFLGYDVFATS